MGEQGKEDGKRQFKYFRHRGDPVFRERHTQVLFDGVHKHLMGSKQRSSTLQHWEQQLQGNHLWAQLMGPEREDRKMTAVIQMLMICLHKLNTFQNNGEWIQNHSTGSVHCGTRALKFSPATSPFLSSHNIIFIIYRLDYQFISLLHKKTSLTR